MRGAGEGIGCTCVCEVEGICQNAGDVCKKNQNHRTCGADVKEPANKYGVVAVLTTWHPNSLSYSLKYTLSYSLSYSLKYTLS